ncbi:restriction endonuclease subunit S [Methanobacterium sp. BAmetb5]|uniref:restriction endonuclease subunit S n=1 Tax=Methanobacterium sp. BAmetb5 TaxID=2025351 RepID=UPI000E8EFBD2|nr:restriction endonuclease subunit S [Methanobacterium sp. BAmetb5]AXV40429.1 MAG: hypothetical protein CIT02_08930 [Methanobacterium sp. BAmetb5]
MKFEPYHEYKDSGVKWVDEIPKNWEAKKLKYIAHISTDKLNKKPDNLPYVGLEHIESWTGVLTDNQMDKVDSSVNLFHKGDILFGKLRPYLAKVVEAPFDGVCTTELVVFSVNGDVNNRFIFHQLLSHRFINIINALTYGVKMPRANPHQIQNMVVCVPPIDEQRKISSFLDKKTSEIDLTIEKDTGLIELLKEKRTALINHVVTKGLDPTVKMKDSGVEWIGRIPDDWDVNRLKFLTAKKAQYGANEEPEYNENKFDYRYVRITDVNDNGGLKKDSYAYLSKENARGFVLEEGDVLFARSGATVGKVYYYSQDDGNCCFAGYMIRYVTNNELLEPQFLLYYSLSKSYKEWIKVVSTQSTIENVSAEKYDELNIPTPKLSQQRQIVKFLDNEIPKIDEIILKIEEKISFLKEYKKSLIHHVVTGKVDVREVAV